MNEDNRPLVMIVDDSRADLFLATHLLRQYPLAGIVTSADGEEAIQHLERCIKESSRLPDVIFLDLRMPKMDGSAVLAALLKVIPANVTPPEVLVLTGCASDPKRLEILQHPFVTDYIIKPLIAADVSRVVSHFGRRDDGTSMAQNSGISP